MSKNYTLILSFDINQVTQALNYEFTSKGKPYKSKRMGPTAGTFNFEKGDTVDVKVIAYEKKEKPDDLPFTFEIENCSLVSIKAPQVPELSMFDSHNAISTFGGWITADETPNIDYIDDLFYAVEKTSSNSLEVTAENGQWQISGYLSVTIDGTPKLFYFDPEGSTGTGLGSAGGC